MFQIPQIFRKKVTLSAFVGGPPVVANDAFYMIEGSGHGRLRMTQRGLPLFDSEVSGRSTVGIRVITDDPIDIELKMDNEPKHEAKVIPLVNPVTIDFLRASRLAMADSDLTAKWRSDGSAAIIRLKKDKVVEERRGAGTGHCLFHPMEPGKYVIDLICSTSFASSYASRVVRIGALRPSITVREIMSGKNGQKVPFKVHTRWATEVWIEHGGQRKPVEGSFELTVPSKATVHAVGPGGRAKPKTVRAVAWFLDDLYRGPQS